MCSTCGKGFAQKGQLKDHQATHSDERNHKCTICAEERFFKTKNGLAHHMKSHFEPEHECKKCGTKFHRSCALNVHMKTHFDPTYSCLQCGKKFHTSSGLNHHMKFHNEPTYQCKQCGKKFHTSGSLKRHEKIH